MSRHKIAIFGASGFVGSALVERLWYEKSHDFTAIIRSSASAWRLARYPIPIRQCNVLSPDQVDEVIAGHNVVVNCTRGARPVMIRGLRNITKAAAKHTIEKFVHLSSLAIYGADPGPETSDERATPEPGSSAYGRLKLEQDDRVLRSHRAGLRSIIICPSVISGPYSPFLLRAAETILRRELVLVEGGEYPCNLIHVDNLVQAIITAVESDNGYGERYFINELEKVTWRQFFGELLEMLDPGFEPPSVSRQDLIDNAVQPARTGIVGRNVRPLFSSEFRRGITVLPPFRALEDLARSVFSTLDPKRQQVLKRRLHGPTVVPKPSNAIRLDFSGQTPEGARERVIRSQMRKVYHSPDKIVRALNYRPFLDPEKRRYSIEQFLEFANVVQHVPTAN